MPHSVDRFLATHTGRLPRPDDLILMIYAKEEGRPVDREALARRIRGAAGEVVMKQRKAGMPRTGADLQSNDKETSLGALAVNFVER